MPETSGIMNGISEGFAKAGERMKTEQAAAPQQTNSDPYGLLRPGERAPVDEDLFQKTHLHNANNAVNAETYYQRPDVQDQIYDVKANDLSTGDKIGGQLSMTGDQGWKRPDLANIYGELPQGPRQLLPNGYYMDETQMEPEEVEQSRKERAEGIIPEELMMPTKKTTRALQSSTPVRKAERPESAVMKKKLEKAESKMRASLDERFKKKVK